MPHFFFTAIRLLFIPVFIGAGFVLYGHMLEFLFGVIPIPKEHSFIFGVLLAQGFLAAASISILFCYPLAFIYQKYSIIVSLSMSLPVLMFRLPGVVNFDRNPITTIIGVYEIAAYVLLLVVGTWLAYGHLSRSNMNPKQDRNFFQR